MTPDAEHREASSHESSPTGAARPFAWVRPAAMVAAAMLAAEGVLYAAWPDPIQVHAENGPLEIAQAGTWTVAAGLGAWAAVRRGNMRNRPLLLWLALLAILAAARELDLHQYANPRQIGQFGVRFRLDWWTHDTTSWWLKGAWLLTGSVLIALMAVPPLLLRWPIVHAARAGHAWAGLLLLAVACMGAGYVSDDVLRHAGLDRETLQGIEETLETLGAAAFLACVVLVACRHAPRSASQAAERTASPDTDC